MFVYKGRADTIWSGHEFTTALQTRKANARPQRHTGAQQFSKATGGLPFGKASDSGNSATDWEIGDIAHHKEMGGWYCPEVTGSGKTQELKIKFPELDLKTLGKRSTYCEEIERTERSFYKPSLSH